jgi:phage-related protein (TIGR01555 family)
MGFRNMIERAVERVDGWANVLTGVGTVLGGRGRGSYSYQGADRLGEGMLEELYHSDAYAARIAEAVPKHALRRGFKVKVGDTELETRVQRAITALHITPRLREAWTWARVFGGGAVLLGCDDGRDASEPIDPRALRRVLFATSVTSREVWPETWDLDPLSQRFGEPVIYRLTRVGGGGGMDTSRVHYSRLVRFEGLPTTRQRRITLKGWGESYLQRAHDLLVEWNGAHTAVNDLVQQSSIGVFKMKDLMSMVASDPDGLLKKRMEAMDLARSVARSILLDAEGEAYERVEVGALTGLPDLLDRYSLRLAGALEMPVSILLGREPAGLNATGEADTRAWYDAIDAERETILKPAVERIVRLVLLSQEGPTSAKEPEGWSVEFPPLWQPTESERATLRKTVADTDAVYLQNGVLTPEEVARSRFRPEGWSAETEVDIAARPSPGAPDDDPPPAPSLPAASDAPPAEQEGLAAPARSGMGGAGGPTKPAGILPIVPANTEGQKPA